MKLTYVAIIELRDGSVKNIFFPDFKQSFEIPEQCESVYFYASNCLDDILQRIITAKGYLPIPSSIENDVDNSMYSDSSQNFLKIQVSTSLKGSISKPFEYSLPLLGATTMLLNASCNAFFTFLALRIATNDEAMEGLSATGGCLAILMSIIIYCFSGTNEQLVIFGRELDNLAFRKKWNSNNDSKAQHLAKFGLGAIAIANTVASAITIYQESNLLGEKAAAQGKFAYPSVVSALAILYSCSYGVCVSSFEVNFALKAANWLSNNVRKFCGPKTPTEYNIISEEPVSALRF